MKLLLGPNGVNLDKSDGLAIHHSGGLPFGRHEQVSELLLGWDEVNPDSPNVNDRAPIWVR